MENGAGMASGVTAYVHTVTCRPFFRRRPKYANTTIENVLQEAFYVVRAKHISRQLVVKHIPAEANARNNSTSITRQWLCNTGCVFYGSASRLYK
jgi:hypothetical protein